MTEWALLVRGIVVVITADEVRDERSNSLMRPIATDGVAWTMCLCMYVRNGDNHSKNS